MKRTRRIVKKARSVMAGHLWEEAKRSSYKLRVLNFISAVLAR